MRVEWRIDCLIRLLKMNLSPRGHHPIVIITHEMNVSKVNKRKHTLKGGADALERMGMKKERRIIKSSMIKRQP